MDNHNIYKQNTQNLTIATNTFVSEAAQQKIQQIASQLEFSQTILISIQVQKDIINMEFLKNGQKYFVQHEVMHNIRVVTQTVEKLVAVNDLSKYDVQIVIGYNIPKTDILTMFLSDFFVKYRQNISILYVSKKNNFDIKNLVYILNVITGKPLVSNLANEDYQLLQQLFYTKNEKELSVLFIFLQKQGYSVYQSQKAIVQSVEQKQIQEVQNEVVKKVGDVSLVGDRFLGFSVDGILVLIKKNKTQKSSIFPVNEIQSALQITKIIPTEIQKQSNNIQIASAIPQTNIFKPSVCINLPVPEISQNIKKQKIIANIQPIPSTDLHANQQQMQYQIQLLNQEIHKQHKQAVPQFNQQPQIFNKNEMQYSSQQPTNIYKQQIPNIKSIVPQLPVIKVQPYSIQHSTDQLNQLLPKLPNNQIVIKNYILAQPCNFLSLKRKYQQIDLQQDEKYLHHQYIKSVEMINNIVITDRIINNSNEIKLMFQSKKKKQNREIRSYLKQQKNVINFQLQCYEQSKKNFVSDLQIPQIKQKNVIERILPQIAIQSQFKIPIKKNSAILDCNMRDYTESRDYQQMYMNKNFGSTYVVPDEFVDPDSLPYSVAASEESSISQDQLCRRAVDVNNIIQNFQQLKQTQNNINLSNKQKELTVPIKIVFKNQHIVSKNKIEEMLQILQFMNMNVKYQ